MQICGGGNKEMAGCGILGFLGFFVVLNGFSFFFLSLSLTRKANYCGVSRDVR